MSLRGNRVKRREQKYLPWGDVFIAVTAVNRAVALGLEWHLGGDATGGAYGVIKLSRWAIIPTSIAPTAVSAAALRFGGLSARLTFTRLLKAFVSKKLLVRGAKDKLGTTGCTGDYLIFHSGTQTPMSNAS